MGRAWRTCVGLFFLRFFQKEVDVRCLRKFDFSGGGACVFSEREDAAARMHKFIFGMGLPRTTFIRVLPHNEI